MPLMLGKLFAVATATFATVGIALALGTILYMVEESDERLAQPEEASPHT